LLIITNKYLYASPVSCFAFASNLILYFSWNSILLNIKTSLYAIAKSFISIIVSYNIADIFEGEFVDRVLDTPDKSAANANNANNAGLAIFLRVAFFLVKLSRILPLLFDLFTCAKRVIIRSYS
jgi:hypothetical protein